MPISESVSSPQVCPVTVQISLSPCVGRMDALTPAPALLAVWASKTISLSLDRASQRIHVILIPAPKTKGKLNGSLSFSFFFFFVSFYFNPAVLITCFTHPHPPTSPLITISLFSIIKSLFLGLCVCLSLFSLPCLFCFLNSTFE